jgi:hypothetical protein
VKWEGNEPQRDRSDWGAGMSHEPVGLPAGVTVNQDEIDRIRHDEISHPAHYTQGIECWDYIASHGMSYLQGNISKYVTRYQMKDGIKDLKKARAYLDKLIATLEAE